MLSRQFASMTTSGLTMLRSLAILEDQTTKPKLKAALGQIRADVQGGSPLSTAMAQHPEHFPPLMVNMIKAGEAGGFLDESLARVARMYEADANLRAKIKAAMTYPVIVLIFSLLLGTGVIIFIVPVFEKMFKNLGGGLPLPTQIMVDAVAQHDLDPAARASSASSAACAATARRCRTIPSGSTSIGSS